MRAAGVILVWAFGLLLVAPAAYPQPPITVGDPVRVSAGRPAVPHVEPHLAAHPTDPALLVGAAITWPDDDPRQGFDESIIAVYRSGDAGRTWKRTDLSACDVDPWVGFGQDEGVFVACLRQSPARTVVYRSEDRGETWGEPTTLPLGGGGSTDHPVLAVDRTGEEDVVYVASGQWFDAAGLQARLYGPSVSVSVDGGESFALPTFVRHDNVEQQPIDIVVLPDGRVGVFFIDYATATFPIAHRRTWLVLSGDRGESFSTPALVSEQTGDEMTWAAAVDTSPRYPGRLYMVVDGFWQRDRTPSSGGGAPDEGGLFVLTSRDGGETWGPRLRVLDSPAGADAQTPSIAINPDGIVGVTWYDTRHDPTGECFDVYFTASLDGGRSFLPEVRVTPETSCPRAVARQRGVAERWPYGGDYSGLAAGADGRFHALWADSRTGIYQLWSAALEVTGATPAATSP